MEIRNLTDEETEIYDQWLDCESVKTGISLFEKENKEDMGLDYTVYLAIRDKETKINQHVIEIAYWRKGWSIRNELNVIASKPIYKLPDAYDKSDIWITCSPAVLQAVVDLFLSNVNDIMCEMWTNSIFPAICTRDNTIRQLANIYAAKYWISESEDDDAFKLMYYDPDKASMEVFYDFNKNKDKYEVVIIFETSC